jgi:hypothetical protein
LPDEKFMTVQPKVHGPQESPRWLCHPATYLLMALIIVGVDIISGPLIRFPVLFVVPVALSGWYYRASWSYSLAVLLPLVRMLLLESGDTSALDVYVIINALVRVVVLVFMAYLVARTARQTRELRQRVSNYVTICAWSRTIEFNGEWISFEEYLKRRFNINTTHGISPDEARKLLGGQDQLPNH